MGSVGYQLEIMENKDNAGGHKVDGIYKAGVNMLLLNLSGIVNEKSRPVVGLGFSFHWLYHSGCILC